MEIITLCMIVLTLCSATKENIIYSESLLQSASKNDPEAQYKMGLCYLYGYGVDIDIKQAFYWFSKASLNGNRSSKEYVGMIADCLDEFSDES